MRLRFLLWKRYSYIRESCHKELWGRSDVHNSQQFKIFTAYDLVRLLRRFYTAHGENGTSGTTQTSEKPPWPLTMAQAARKRTTSLVLAGARRAGSGLVSRAKEKLRPWHVPRAGLRWVGPGRTMKQSRPLALPGLVFTVVWNRAVFADQSFVSNAHESGSMKKPVFRRIEASY